MAPPLSKDLRDQVVKWRAKYNWLYHKLAEVAGCSIGTVFSILHYHNTYGQSTNSLGCKIGRTRLLGIDDLKYLDELLEVESSIYLDEVWDKLDEVRRIAVSVATLQRAIVQLDISRKGVSKEAAERNNYLLGTWTDTGALTGNLIICYQRDDNTYRVTIFGWLGRDKQVKKIGVFSNICKAL
jgi:hypothetical protein